MENTELLEKLKARNCRLATAESCTGGLVGAAVTAIPGISEVYAGGIIAYENAVKMALLGVPEEVLNTVGAVSEACAQAMASGAARALHTQCAVSTTGIAGPGGGTPGKPVGTVCIGLYLNGEVYAETNHFSGNRDEVRAATVKRVLELLTARL